MNDFISKFIIAIISATIAIFFKHFYDKRQRKIDLKKKRIVLIDIIENVILINLNRHLTSYNNLIDNYKFNTTNFCNTIHYLTSSLDPKIISFFSQIDIIDIFKQTDLKISNFYEGIHDLETYKKFAPILLEENYFKNIGDSLDKKCKVYNMNTEELLNSEIHKNELEKELQYYYDSFFKSLEEQKINTVNYIENFSDILNKLKAK